MHAFKYTYIQSALTVHGSSQIMCKNVLSYIEKLILAFFSTPVIHATHFASPFIKNELNQIFSTSS